MRRLLVAEADAERFCLAHEVAFGIDVLKLAGNIFKGHAAHVAIALRHHKAELAFKAAECRLHAALCGEDAVLSIGDAAALGMAGDGNAGLAPGLRLNLLSDVLHD